MGINLFIDIETLPTELPIIQQRATSDIGPPANYKSEEAIAKWWSENGNAKKEEAISKTALDGTWGRVFCIGFAVNDGPIQVIADTDEVNVLNQLATRLNNLCKADVKSGGLWDQSATWIGHNVQDFDLRFIWQRSRIHGVRLPFALPLGKPSYSKGPYVFDTMREWAGWKGFVKQTDLELAFGLERNDPLPTGGAEVFQAFKEGRTADVIAHCTEDVRLLRDLYQRMVA